MTNSQSPIFSRSRAAANLEKYILEERLVIGTWSTTDVQGREVGCLLHALGNGELNITSPEHCPSSVIPRWLAEFVPGAFDDADKHNMMTVAKLFHETLTVSDSFGNEDWEKVEREFKVRLVEQVVRFAEPRTKDLPVWEQVMTACSAVCVALRSGDEEELKEARELALDASYAVVAADAAVVSAVVAVASAASIVARAVSTDVAVASYAVVDAAADAAAARLEQFQILLETVKQVKNSKM